MSLLCPNQLHQIWVLLLAKHFPSPGPAGCQKITLFLSAHLSELLQDSSMNWWLGWEVGEPGVSQATQELEAGSPVPPDISNTSLFVSLRGRALSDFQQKRLLGPKKSFPTRILLQLMCLCEKHSFLKASVFWHKPMQNHISLKHFWSALVVSSGKAKWTKGYKVPVTDSVSHSFLEK